MHVEDVNDVPPIFRDNPVQIQIQEDVSFGEVIASIIAIDGDIEGNAKVKNRSRSFKIINSRSLHKTSVTHHSRDHDSHHYHSH